MTRHFWRDLALLLVFLFGLFAAGMVVGTYASRFVGFMLAFSLAFPGALLVGWLETRRG